MQITVLNALLNVTDYPVGLIGPNCKEFDFLVFYVLFDHCILLGRFDVRWTFCCLFFSCSSFFFSCSGILPSWIFLFVSNVFNRWKMTYPHFVEVCLGCAVWPRGDAWSAFSILIFLFCGQILTVFSETCCTNSCSDMNGKIWHFSIIFFLFPKNIEPRHELQILFWMRFLRGQMYNLPLWTSSDWHSSRWNSDILSPRLP